MWKLGQHFLSEGNVARAPSRGCTGAMAPAGASLAATGLYDDSPLVNSSVLSSSYIIIVINIIHRIPDLNSNKLMH